jgi:[acyl-carrier-protein] S-malonyltransferase
VFSDETAMKFVMTRGNAMAAAAALESTSMAAVLGGVEDEVLAALAKLNLEPANRNGAGQIVAAGAASDIALL